MLDLDALSRLDEALAEISSDPEKPRETLSPLAREIVTTAVDDPASRCPHLAGVLAR